MIVFSLTLLVACGGSEGGSSAGTPIETLSLGSQTVTIGGNNGVAPLSNLDNFTETATSPTIHAIQAIDSYFSSFKSVTMSRIDGIGILGNEEHVTCKKGGGCVKLPGDTENQSPWLLFNTGSLITNLSLIGEPYYIINNNRFPEGRVNYFEDSSYTSRTSSSTTIGDVTFAREISTATRSHDKAPLEFQTFTGWFDDGGILGTTRIKVGKLGDEQYRFFSYYVGKIGDNAFRQPPGGRGRATWEGVAVASIKNVTAIQNGWSFIRGDATVDVDDLTSPDIDLRFDNWHTIDGRKVSLPATIFDNISLPPSGSNLIGFSSGTFQDTSPNQAWGWFHGENGREVGGHFHTETLTGAFGAVRQ